MLAPAGRVGVSVFAELERNPVARVLSDALDRQLGDGASFAKRNEHALADRDKVGALFREAGFAHVRIETVAKTSRYPSVSEYVRFQLQATPLAAVLEPYDPPERDRLIALVVDELATELTAFVREREFAFPQAAHIATATTTSVEDRPDSGLGLAGAGADPGRWGLLLGRQAVLSGGPSRLMSCRSKQAAISAGSGEPVRVSGPSSS